jgi:hypothetical protein
MSEVQIRLTQEQFNYLCQVLAQRPYGEVAQLLQELVRQSKEPPS